MSRAWATAQGTPSRASRRASRAAERSRRVGSSAVAAAARAARARRFHMETRMNWTRSSSDRASAGQCRVSRSQAARPSPQ